MAPRVGFEPTTDRLTADCSTTELPRSVEKPGEDFSKGAPLFSGYQIIIALNSAYLKKLLRGKVIA